MSYTGTKSYNSTFRDTGSQSVSEQEIVLTGLISDTDYSIVVTSTNIAGFSNSSDAVLGTTLTGRKLPPSTFPSLHISSSTTLHHESLHLIYSPSHLHTPCLFFSFCISSSLLLPQMTVFPPFLSLFSPPAPPPPPPIVVPPTSLTTRREPRTFTLTITRASNMGGQVRLEWT